MFMKNSIFLISFLICLYTNAQTPIDVYQTFGEYVGFSTQINSLDIQPDGKMLIGGNFTEYNNNPEKKLMRCNIDGSKDVTFNVTGTGFTGDNNTYIYSINAIEVQPDGKILIGGNFTFYNGITQNRLIRLNSDGSKDTTFNIGTGFPPTSTVSGISLIKLQSDGKIIVGGSFTSYNGVAQNNITSQGLIRLNPNGSIDSTFNIGTGFFGGNYYSLDFQTDGKMLIGGSFTSYQGITANRLIRLNSNGSIDSSFNIGVGFNSGVIEPAIQSDGKILIAGDFTTFNGLVQNRLVRLNTDGSKDTTFDIGSGFESYVTKLIIQPDGKILVGGNFTTFNSATQNRIVLLNPNGTKDTTFIVGTGFNNSVGQILLQSDGKFLLSGNFTIYNGVSQNGFVRIDTNGTEDDSYLLGNPGFNDGATTGTPYPGVSTLCLQSDGKLLVGGSFVSFNGITENKLIRFNSDGKKDNTFNIGSGFNNGNVFAIAVQPDGKILVGGNFTTFNGVTQNRIVRLNTNGTKDTTFIVGTGFNNNLGQILLQPDGKILISGYFSSYNGVAKNILIRLNQDGSIDNSLISFPPQNYPVLALQNDGKIITGNFSGVLARLNSDGTNDASFNVGSGLNNQINKITIQPDNKILVGGKFTTYNGLSQVGLIRFNSDGTKDTTFNVGGIGVGDVSAGGVKDIAIQPDGKIIICGMSNYNGITQQGLIRLMPDGTLDSSFIFGDSFNSYAFPNYSPSSIALKNNGVILVGGRFRNYFNYASSGLVGIRGNAILSNQNFEIFNKNNISLFPNPVDNVLNFQTSGSLSVSQIIIYDLMGKQINNYINIINNSIDINNLSRGIYLIKIIASNNDVITNKIIKN